MINTKQEKLYNCPKCEGSGKFNITIDDTESRESKIANIKCVYCDGKGKMTAKQLAQNAWEDARWCNCENPSGNVKFYNDGEHPECIKHHYRCTDCGKIVQIG